MKTCPQCGDETDALQEGYCETCWQDRQDALDKHNARMDYWESLTPEQRDYQIKNAL